MHKVSLEKKQARTVWSLCSKVHTGITALQDQTHNTGLKECKIYILANLSVASAYVENPKYTFKLGFGRRAWCFVCAYVHFWVGNSL